MKCAGSPEHSKADNCSLRQACSRQTITADNSPGILQRKTGPKQGNALGLQGPGQKRTVLGLSWLDAPAAALKPVGSSPFNTPEATAAPPSYMHTMWSPAATKHLASALLSLDVQVLKTVPERTKNCCTSAMGLVRTAANAPAQGLEC